MINNKRLKYEHNFRYLGIDVDQHLTMKSTCETIYRNASHKLYTYRLVRGSLTMSAAIQVLKAMFMGVLDYGNVFLTGVNKNSLSDLQKLQKDAIRCYLKIKQTRDARVNGLHTQLNIYLLDHRRTVQPLTCVKKAVAMTFCYFAILRFQGLKVLIPIPRDDAMQKKNILLGLFYFESTSTGSKNNRR